MVTIRLTRDSNASCSTAHPSLPPQMFLTCTGIECGIFSGQRTALLYDVAKQHPSGLSCHFCSDIICTSPLYHLLRTSLTKPRPAHTNWLLHLEDQNNGCSYLKICEGGGRHDRSARFIGVTTVVFEREGGSVPADSYQQLRRCQNVIIEFAAAVTHTTDVRIQREPTYAIVEFCKVRRNSHFALLEKCVCIYSEVYTYTQGGAPEIQTPTQWALIARIITAMPPVLSSSSILPPHSRKENFGAHYNDLCVSFEIIKTYSKFNIWAKLGPSALASHFSTNTTNPQ